MYKKFYVLKTRCQLNAFSLTSINDNYSIGLSAWVARPSFGMMNKKPCIAKSAEDAWWFKTKKEAKKWSNFYKGCCIDCYWVKW